MGFTHWSGLPFPSPGDLPDPGIEPASPQAPALLGRFFTAEPPGKPSLGLKKFYEHRWEKWQMFKPQHFEKMAGFRLRQKCVSLLQHLIPEPITSYTRQ